MSIDRGSVRGLMRAVAYDSNGSRVGRIAQVFLADGTDEPAWVAVDVTRTRGMRLLPLVGAAIKGRSLVVRSDRSTIRSAPRVDLSEGMLSSQEEARLLEHYGLDGGGLDGGGLDGGGLDGGGLDGGGLDGGGLDGGGLGGGGLGGGPRSDLDGSTSPDSDQGFSFTRWSDRSEPHDVSPHTAPASSQPHQSAPQEATPYGGTPPQSETPHQGDPPHQGTLSQTPDAPTQWNDPARPPDGSAAATQQSR